MGNIKFIDKIKGLFFKTNKLKNTDLEKVSGSGEPEEFDWKPKGFVTPVKEQNNKDDWAFSVVGDKDPKDILKK